jgi:hypothetical protein
MTLTSIGKSVIAHAITGDIGTGKTYKAFDTADACLGVGDGTTAFAASQTNLQGTNKLRKNVDTAPAFSNSDTTVTFVATFTTAEANYAWQEDGIFNALTAGEMLTRNVAYLITKTSSVSVVFTKTLTITV